MSVYVNEGMEVHWWWPGVGFCDEYVTGDTVIAPPDPLSAVTCQECLEMIHA